MSKEFTKSYAINRIAELNEQIVEMTDNQNQTMRYLNRIRDENNQLKQQLEEKDKEIKKLNWQLKDKDFIIKNLNHSLSVAPNANAGQRARIDELTKIVEEKDKEIAHLKEMDNYHLLYELAGADETIANLKKQLEEKDKEIELLKHLGNHEITVEMFKENTKLIIEKRQFAISELEKVKKLTENLLEKFCNSWEYNQKYMRGHRHIEYYDLIQGIDNQIKELKGE